MRSLHNEMCGGALESFGFDTTMRMGMGGFLTTAIVPVVLFRDGRALPDVSALLTPNQLATHDAAIPYDWTEWRRANGELQLQKSDGWERLPFHATYAKLPEDFRLTGSYRALSGVGSIALGGASSVAA